MLSLLFSSRMSESSMLSFGVFDLFESFLLSAEIGESSPSSILIASAVSSFGISIFRLKVGDGDSVS